MSIPMTLVLSMAAALAVNVCKKYFTSTLSGGISGSLVFNAVSGLTAALILLLWGGFGTPSGYTVCLGVIFGAITTLQGIANLSALQCGPMSYTMVISSFSTLISALSGVAFFGETLGWAQIVGMLLMLVSFVFAVKTDAKEKKANAKWLLLCLITFISTGGIGVMQKIHQSSEHREELNAFLVIAFLVSAVLCGIFTLLWKVREMKTDRKNTRAAHPWLPLAIMLISGAGVAVNNKFNLYLSGVMDSAVFFPIVNGGGLVLATLAALLLFRERLTKRQWMGVAFGIASVIFLCNPFG